MKPEVRQANYAANRDKHRAYNNAYYASNEKNSEPMLVSTEPIIKSRFEQRRRTTTSSTPRSCYSSVPLNVPVIVVFPSSLRWMT